MPKRKRYGDDPRAPGSPNCDGSRGNGALGVEHGILEVRRLPLRVVHGPLGVENGPRGVQRGKLEVENLTLDPVRQRLEVENPVRGVERGAPGVENSRREVERGRLEVENLTLEAENHTLEPERRRRKVEERGMDSARRLRRGGRDALDRGDGAELGVNPGLGRAARRQAGGHGSLTTD